MPSISYGSSSRCFANSVQKLMASSVDVVRHVLGHVFAPCSFSQSSS